MTPSNAILGMLRRGAAERAYCMTVFAFKECVPISSSMGTEGVIQNEAAQAEDA